MGSSGFSWKLADHPKLPKGKTVAVVVLDGWGEATPNEYNCIHKAETPCMDSLKKVQFFALFWILFLFTDFKDLLLFYKRGVGSSGKKRLVLRIRKSCSCLVSDSVSNRVASKPKEDTCEETTTKIYC